MCSFYWSHRLGPLQPVIRLQVLYPLVLSLLIPIRYFTGLYRGLLPRAPTDDSTRVPFPTSLRVSAVYFSICGLAALVIVPIHRLCAYSVPVISKHSRVTMNLIPRWERWTNCALKRWMIRDRLRSLSSDPLLTSPPLQALLPLSPAWSNTPEGAFCKTTKVISSNGASQKPSKFLLTTIMMPVFAFKKIWSHRVQIVLKLSELQCQTSLTSFLENIPTNVGDGCPETWK